jgi:serine phosphatase RsbU (regulator of sigma subunit)
MNKKTHRLLRPGLGVYFIVMLGFCLVALLMDLPVLAGVEGLRYKEQQIQLRPGDEIYLYTDGVTEAHDVNKKLYGTERLIVSLNKTAGMSVDEICKSVKADVDAFQGEAEQFDDITMLCFRLNEVETKC